MGCTISTKVASSIWPQLKKKNLSTATLQSEINHNDTCTEDQCDSFNLQDPNVEIPTIANLSDSKAVEEELSGLNNGELYCDPDFPAEDQVLYFSRKPTVGKIEWKRPHKLVHSPMMQIDGAHRSDIMQGILGDCWFLSSCVAVSQQTKLINRVIPVNQMLFGDDYKGVVKFNFWRFGSWVTVYVDDRLPTVENKLLYARSSNKQEFWVSLIEKAYAKLHGCYENISGGQSMDALVDLTSGIAERYDLENFFNIQMLYRYLHRGSFNGALITCSRKGDWKAATQADPNGLVSGHAYTITSLKIVQSKSQGKVRLLRIRNPWGDGTEWNGMWCDADSIWDEVEEGVKNEIQYMNSADGEFWMTMDDFCNEFEEVSICTVGPDYDGDGIADHLGQTKAIKGQWIEGKNAGGCRNDIGSFSTNPQYLLSIKASDAPDSQNKCSVVIALMQRNRRLGRPSGSKMLQIGFVVYKITRTKQKMSKQFFQFHQDCGSSGSYINYREVIGRFDLAPGLYVIVPATFEQNNEAEFMIRVYSENEFELMELI